MAVIQTGGSTTGVANVDSNYNMNVTLPTTKTQAGYALLADSEGDEVHFVHKHIETSSDSYIFYDTVVGSAVNTNLWNQTTATQTISQATGLLTLNATTINTANTYAILSSIKQIQFLPDCALHVHVVAKTPNIPQANATMELGWGVVATNAAPTDGIYFRWGSDGLFYACLNFNGTEVKQAITAPIPNVMTFFGFDIEHSEVKFYVNHTYQCTLTPGSNPIVNTDRMSLFARTATLASAPTDAPVLTLGDVSSVYKITPLNIPFREFMGKIGRGAYQSPVTPFGQTANHANSTSPTSATLSNTAAGYTTLGGRYQFAAVAGAATDYALFAYQVPVGYQLVVHSIRIGAMNTGATVATSATVLDWAIGVNSSGVSLATTDGTGTWAPRRIPVGMMGFKVGDLVGAEPPELEREFHVPLVVDSGRYLHIILQVPVGTATASEVFRGDVMINGYFE